MIPLGILLIVIGALLAGTILKLFSDHRQFRRELREVNQQLEDVLDIVATLALAPADEVRLARAQRRVGRGTGDDTPRTVVDAPRADPTDG